LTAVSSGSVNVPAPRWLRSCIVCALFALALAAGLFTARVATSDTASGTFGSATPPSAPTIAASSSAPWRTATQNSTMARLVVVVIGAESCAFSQPAVLRHPINVAWDSIQAVANRESRTATIAGVAVDPDVDIGNEYLAQFAIFEFTEAGMGWNGTIAQYLTRAPLGGPLTTPQVVVLDVDTYDQIAGAVVSLRYRIVGYDDIVRWSRMGARLPQRVVPLTNRSTAAIAQ